MFQISDEGGFPSAPMGGETSSFNQSIIFSGAANMAAHWLSQQQVSEAEWHLHPSVLSNHSMIQDPNCRLICNMK